MTDVRFDQDSSGFPLVRIDELGAWLHWYPVTKLQFEYFMCERPSSRFDSEWYESVRALNGRISPHEVNRQNYASCFITGLLPSEARLYAHYCGPEYDIPTVEEWNKAYKLLAGLPRVALDDLLAHVSTDRGRRMTRKLDELSLGRSEDVAGRAGGRGAQMWMSGGVLEWVSAEGVTGRWGGRGSPADSFDAGLYDADSPNPRYPMHPEERRIPHFGFRLIRRDV